MSQSVEDKVRAVLMADDTGLGPISTCGQVPRLGENQYLSTFELDMRDWGCVYGMAFAIARAEDPFEPTEKVAKRALDAAQGAWSRYSGGMAYPPTSRLAARVVAEYKRALDDPRQGRLGRAIETLEQALGFDVPAASEDDPEPVTQAS